MAIVLWSFPIDARTVIGVPKLTDEDRQFAKRLGAMLRALRNTAGWTIPEAAEAINVPSETLGNWERAKNAPKGYDLGRLFRGYEAWGAKWEWFFDPPEQVVIDPVQAHLDAAARSGAIRADEAEARVLARRQRAAAKRAAGRGKRSKPGPPGSPQ